jgi:alanine dehydrogenase
LKIRLIPRSEVEGLLNISEAIEAVEEAFRVKGQGKTQMPPKSYIFFRKFGGDFRVMPAYLEGLGAAGVKVVNAHPENPEKHDLPSVMAIILLLSPETGAPLAVMDGTLITNMRTGAAAAVAAKYLARKDSKIVGIVGSGAQARTQLVTLNEVIGITEVRVEDVVPGKAKQYAEELGERLGLNIQAVDTTEEAVMGVDVVITVTPRRSPLVMDDWISEGAHINAIGADAPGKQELDPQILKRAKIIVDDWEQASHSGEVNVPLSDSILTRDDIYADIGEVVAGKKPGRVSDDEVTVFDSTGLAVQDIAVAWRVYQKAMKEGAGSEIDLL